MQYHCLFDFPNKNICEIRIAIDPLAKLLKYLYNAQITVLYREDRK